MSEKVLDKVKDWLQNNVEHSKGILLPLDRDSQALLDYIEEWENEDGSIKLYTSLGLQNVDLNYVSDWFHIEDLEEIEDE